MNKKILKLMAHMLAIATFALIIASCEENENTDSSKETEINSISVEPRSLYMEVDSTEILTVTFSPDDALTDSLVWSTYNKAIATVNVTGPRTAVVKGVSIGTTTINIVTSNNKKAICEVTVSKTVPLVAITITPNDTLLHLEPGNTVDLVATQGPANATNYRPVWTSSNPEVVIVENGLVEATGTGRAVITVTSGNVSKSVKVLVTNPLSSITIEPADELHLAEIGDTQQLTATSVPATPKGYNPRWVSSNENIVAVSQTGLVTAVGVGTARVTVASGIVSSFVNVKVTSAYLRDLVITNTDLFISTGEDMQINVTPLPETAENYLLTYTSSDESVATVSETGLVTGISSGIVTITVSSGEVTKSTLLYVDVTHFMIPLGFGSANSMTLEWNGAGYWDMNAEGGDPFCYTSVIGIDVREKTEVMFTIEYQCDRSVSNGQIFFCNPYAGGGVSTDEDQVFENTGIDPNNESLWRTYTLNLVPSAINEHGWGEPDHSLRFDYVDNAPCRLLVRNARILYR
jgi:uncharacterized protein YjdB